jgi:hypothetical protein
LAETIPSASSTAATPTSLGTTLFVSSCIGQPARFLAEPGDLSDLFTGRRGALEDATDRDD